MNKTQKRGKTMKKSVKISLITVSVCVLLFGASAVAYRIIRTQGFANSYTINQKEKAQSKVLILTQQSHFKDSVMAKVKDTFEGQPLFIQVQDISTIDNVKQKDWDRILLITTVQSSDLPEKAVHFIKKEANFSKVHLFVTADSGRWPKKPKEVDVVTTTSKKSNIDTFSNAINQVIQKND